MKSAAMNPHRVTVEFETPQTQRKLAQSANWLLKWLSVSVAIPEESDYLVVLHPRRQKESTSVYRRNRADKCLRPD
jgi:hypothetical protein